MFFTIERTKPVLKLGKLFEIYKVFIPEFSMKKALATKPRLFYDLTTYQSTRIRTTRLLVHYNLAYTLTVLYVFYIFNNLHSFYTTFILFKSESTLTLPLPYKSPFKYSLYIVIILPSS